MQVQPNPAVPVTYDTTTGELHLPIDQTQGSAVVAEANDSGDLYEVPAGKTFTGLALLIVGAGAGLVTIVDGSSAVIHSAAGGGVAAELPASVAGVQVTAVGGGGNQLAVDLGDSSQVISAVVAGYVK